MNHFTTDLVQALVTKQDVTEVFRCHLEMSMNRLLETELTTFLDYEKYDRIGVNSGNSRNGAYTRTLHTEYGDLQLTIPRDRNGEFKQQTVSKEAVYLAVGIREDGSKEVLTYTIAPTESAYVWKELLQDIRERGVQEVLLFISDGLKGIVDATQQVYPQAKYQTCCVHLARNIAHKVRVSDRAEICEDFKSVYRADNEQAGKAALETFCDKWKSTYPKVVKSLRENPYIFTFYSFPKSIWRSIYSTNLIESFNKQIKRYTKRKDQFPHEEALEKFLVSQFEIYNQRFATRCHIGFDQARSELLAMFSTKD